MILNLRQAAIEDDSSSNPNATQVSTRQTESIIYEGRASDDYGDDLVSLDDSDSAESFPSFIDVNSREQKE